MQENMENIQRLERDRKKLMLLLKIKEEHISGPGVGTVSDGQEMGWFLEEVDFSWDFQ